MPFRRVSSNLRKRSRVASHLPGKEHHLEAFRTSIDLGSNHGDPVEAFGHHVIRMTSAETGGRLDITVKPGEGLPLHSHAHEDEFFRILSGSLTFWSGGERVDLSEGACILLPRGVPHRFENNGTSDVHATIILTPGRFEGFFPAVAQRQPATPEAMAAIAAEFGLTFLAPDA